jgi:hypothetical protein
MLKVPQWWCRTILRPRARVQVLDAHDARARAHDVAPALEAAQRRGLPRAFPAWDEHGAQRAVKTHL